MIAGVAAMLFVRPLLAEDFYEQQLHDGKSDRAAGKFVEASDELRIAAFGFLDRPLLLTEALVNLALAQNSLGQPTAQQTLDRFLDVEQRFATYVPAAIDAPTRTAFESLLLQMEPRATLTAIQSLSRITRSEAQKVADLPVEKRAAAFSEGARRAPRDVEWPLAAAKDAASRNLDEDVVRWSRRALNIDKENEAARALLAHALTRRSECREALSQIARFSADALKQRSELVGDQLVCLTNEKRWSDAESLAAKLPDAVKQRPDVARATQMLSARRSPGTFRADVLRPAATPGTSMTSGSTEPARPQTPPSTAGKQTQPSTQSASQSPVPKTQPPVQKTQAPVETATQFQGPNAARAAQALESSRSLIRGGRFGEAVQVLQPALNADPSNRQIRLALLEAATLAHDWNTALAQVSTTKPYGAGEEASMFYAAATLYENGRTDEARPLMERARPNLNDTPMIDYYYRMIVGRTTRK
ncbi:MAG: hypothetical protein ACXVIJ_00055 [Thermoanaerobaculia bacterium]